MGRLYKEEISPIYKPLSSSTKCNLKKKKSDTIITFQADKSENIY